MGREKRKAMTAPPAAAWNGKTDCKESVPENKSCPFPCYAPHPPLVIAIHLYFRTQQTEKKRTVRHWEPTLRWSCSLENSFLIKNLTIPRKAVPVEFAATAGEEHGPAAGNITQQGKKKNGSRVNKKRDEFCDEQRKRMISVRVTHVLNIFSPHLPLSLFSPS